MWTLPGSLIRSMWLFVKPYVTLALYKKPKWLKGFGVALMWKALKQWALINALPVLHNNTSTDALNQAAYIGSYSAAGVSGKTSGDLNSETIQAVVMKGFYLFWWEQS